MARHNWEEMLRCEFCGRVGWVRLSEESSQPPCRNDGIYVEKVPDGFKDAGGNGRFHCIDHPAAEV